jgi:hypothetical protein
MLKEFETDEMKSIFSNILLRLQEETEDSVNPVQVSEVKRKPTGSSTSTSAGVKSEDPPVTPTKKVKQSDFAKITLARMQAMQNKKVEKLKQKTDLLKEKELSTLKSKPEINRNSQKLGKRDLNITERYEKELEKSTKRLEEKKKKLHEEKERKITSELTFKPNIKTKGPKRTTEEFFQFNLDWNKRKLEKTKEKKIELEEKEVAELKSLPEIDKNSAYLVEQMGTRKPIEVRLVERLERTMQKIESKRSEVQHPFAPTVGDKSKKLAKKKSTENVFTRLFNLSFDEASPRKSPKFGQIKASKSFVHPSSRNKSLDITFSN